MKLYTLRNILLGLSLGVGVFGLGYQLGAKEQGKPFSSFAIEGKEKEKPTSVDFSLFWNVWNKLSLSYVDKKVLDPQKMTYGAISGLVSSLGDPYTVFLPPEQNKEAKDDLSGKFEGIGAQLGVKDKKIIVVAPLKGAPAEEAGLKPGDWIMKVDGKDTVNWTLPEAVSNIRGPKGTKVRLTVFRKDDQNSKDIDVTRDQIKVASVEWDMKYADCSQKQEIGCMLQTKTCPTCAEIVYLKLGRFGDGTNDDWKGAVDAILKKLQEDKNGIHGIIFDLRNNPGGYLSGSVFIASEFLPDGVVVIQENAEGDKQQYTVNRKGKLTNIPLVVLINKGSASASEIVAGALQVRKRAKLVGETSFGKGSIQEAIELAQGAGIHITTAKWLLPNSHWINGTGIDPDVKIENDEKKPDVDLQLQKAAETLLKQ